MSAIISGPETEVIVTASSQDGNFPIANVNDGNTGTRWGGSTQTTVLNSWVQFAYAEGANVDRVRLKQYDTGYYGCTKYKIRYAEYEGDWTDSPEYTVASADDSQAIAPITARFFRIVPTAAGAGNWNVWELELWGTLGGLLPDVLPVGGIEAWLDYLADQYLEDAQAWLDAH